MNTYMYDSTIATYDSSKGAYVYCPDNADNVVQNKSYEDEIRYMHEKMAVLKAEVNGLHREVILLRKIIEDRSMSITDIDVSVDELYYDWS